MKYCELKTSEKKELRETLFYDSINSDGYTDFDYLSIEEQDTVRNCNDPSEIPEGIMESAYGIYDFAEDDFFCNVEG